MSERRPVAGAKVVVQGDRADAFYVVQSGSLQVVADGEVVGEIREGGSFGTARPSGNLVRWP